MGKATIPAWALQHVRDNLPLLGQVYNVRVHRRGVVFGNTRFGAVVLTKSRFGAPTHRLLPSPRERLRFPCPTCHQALEFRQLVVPTTVHCGHCGKPIAVDMHGRVDAPAPASAPPSGSRATARITTRARTAPPVPQARCAGETASGAPCHNLARPDSSLCRRHARTGPSAASLAAEALAATANAGSTSTPALVSAARTAMARRMPEWAALNRSESADEAAPQTDAQLEAMKTTFINSAAHELQTPMTPLLLSLRTLEGAPNSEPQQAAVRQAVRNAKRLEDVISSVVRVSQVQAGQLPLALAPTDLSPLLEAAAAAWKPKADAAGLRLAVRVPRSVPVVADEARLREAVDHLLSNAIRFSEPGGRITVTAKRLAGGADLAVEDEGCGFDAADAQRIFEPFIQLEAARMQTQGGLGLGLFFARAIAKAHRGSLAAHSDGPGKGARFAVTLPAPAAHAAHRRAATTAPKRT
ncbi:MAG: HAMP domain-containing sensor histidine kinase [bacterium]